MSATKNSSRPRLSEEDRAQKRAAERELMAEAIEQLRSSEGWKRWLDVRRHFHHYSFHNQLLIAHARPGATRVAGFRRWLSLGYCVRKGERAIRIWAPCPPSAKRLGEWRQAGADPAERPRTFFRLVAVFDRSQVDPLPDFPGGPVDLDPPIEPISWRWPRRSLRTARRLRHLDRFAGNGRARRRFGPGLLRPPHPPHRGRCRLS